MSAATLHPVAMHSPGAAEPSLVELARSAFEQGHAALVAGDPATALRWLERAHRLVPHDPNVTLTLASLYLSGNPTKAGELFLTVTQVHDVKQAWLGLAAARLRFAGSEAAAAPLAVVLSRHAFTPEVAGLAEQIAGKSGWCGIRSDGRLELHARGSIEVLQDGYPINGPMLPPDWIASRSIEVRTDGRHLLGSPIQAGAIRRIVGCAEPWNGGIRGWAWHPADPDRHPQLTLRWPSIRLERTIVADDESGDVADTGPLARPRLFQLTRAQLPDGCCPLHITGPDGSPLLGSPLDPGADPTHLDAATLRLEPGTIRDKSTALPQAGAPLPTRPVAADRRQRGTAVVIPVHNGGAVTLACLDSVLASIPRGTRIVVVDDGSTDPALIASLDGLVATQDIQIVRHKQAQGFPASANAGILAARGRDVVLLNSDTLVPPSWLQRLRTAAYSACDIGTVTPLSNNASILSYPDKADSNPCPDQAATNRLDRLAERANGGVVVDIPVGVGFCLYLRRDCLTEVGVFRADLFAQGYAEENDLCLRARRLGWRNVALPGLFVGHLGGMSFGSRARYLRLRNEKIIERLHPGHDALIQDFIARDPLAEPRRRIDLLRWRASRRNSGQSVVLISHDEGGGVEQRLARAARAHKEAGRRPIVLRPAETAAGHPAMAIRDGVDDDFVNLVFAMPRELPTVLGLLRAARPLAVEVHHFLNHAPAVHDLVAQLGVPYDVHVHDYAWFCPRVALVRQDRYCGEPEIQDCETCVAVHGQFLKEDIAVSELYRRSASFLASARTVIAPSDDTAARMKRHFPATQVMIMPHEDDCLIPAVIRRRKDNIAGNGRLRICIVGGIGVHKGYDVLLACARDAARRNLDLEFVIVGHTIDDTRMMATGRVFITGRYSPDEAIDLIGQQHADLGFVASIWPETWCLTLGDIWRAGLAAAAFDIGAPAERIRRTGRGFLLPLGLPASAINNALITAVNRQDTDDHLSRQPPR